jgi:hypothetical protein
LNEGVANVYRPIIAFIPIMIQVLLFSCFLTAMLLARPWVYSNSTTRGQAALSSAALRVSNYLSVAGRDGVDGGTTGARPVAEGYQDEQSTTPQHYTSAAADAAESGKLKGSGAVVPEHMLR